MIAKIFLYLAVAAAAAAGSYFIIQSTYDETAFASEEARTSLEVSEAQSAELLASTTTSNMIAYAILGALMTGASGFAANPRALPAGRGIGLVVGLILGAVAGVAMAQIGHLYDAKIAFPRDPMLYWVGRLFAMFSVLGIACGVAIAAAGKFSKDITDAIVGGLLGAGALTIIYCFVAGAATRIEGHQYIYPAFPENRAVLIGLSILVGFGSMLLLVRKSETATSKTEATSETQPTP